MLILSIADNFHGNAEKLKVYYEMFNSVQIMDTTQIEHEVLTILENVIPVFAQLNTLLP